MHVFEILRNRVTPYRFRMKETDDYLAGRIGSNSLWIMEGNFTFRLEDEEFLVGKELEAFTVLLQTETPGFQPSPISGFPGMFAHRVARTQVSRNMRSISNF